MATMTAAANDSRWRPASEGMMSPFVFYHRGEQDTAQAANKSTWTLPIRPLRL